ncbi:hypothetical protein [Streptomyces sp. NPDC101165]|uniref:hypothetical protein n=1 Tax=Streptomyces sp. NPDC101165 TaxID=3366119 RepID=UPI00382314B6
MGQRAVYRAGATFRSTLGSAVRARRLAYNPALHAITARPRPAYSDTASAYAAPSAFSAACRRSPPTSSALAEGLLNQFGLDILPT